MGKKNGILQSMRDKRKDMKTIADYESGMNSSYDDVINVVDDFSIYGIHALQHWLKGITTRKTVEN